ncbi:DUF4338 domain-containing protein [Thermoplasmatales archaeon AK]|nr:DUF4338 domain-containing protein [Thermoplasmatales archaeon AK]
MIMESEINESRSVEKKFTDSVAALRNKVIENLVSSGFSIEGKSVLSVPQDKEFIRKVHANAVFFLREKKKAFIEKYDGIFIEKFIIDGKELDVHNIQPMLRKIDTKLDNALFNWVKLHWSIPISAGYGRRLRYVVYDKGNSAVMGIIGLADPVYALGDRDRYIGWTTDVKKKNLKHVMDAFVLGAVPPYSYILGGKLIASLLTSPRIRTDFSKQYKGKKSRISGELFDGKLVAITTASAFGKSSVYDRINITGGSKFLHIGWSKGSGEFHFLNGLYEQLRDLALPTLKWTKNPRWGKGSRNRRVVIQEALRILNLPPDLIYHNITRELFLVPLGSKSLNFLRNETKQIGYYDISQNEIVEFALERWMIPRSKRKPDYLEFKREQYSLSLQKEQGETSFRPLRLTAKNCTHSNGPNYQ